jgi:two-component system NarL family sensor kinase
VAQFALCGLVAMALIGLVSVAVIQQLGRREAIRQAKQVTRLAGQGIVAPAVTSGVLAGDPAALRRLDRVVRRSVLRDGIVRVKVWEPSGRIAYSDEPRLIGATYPFGAEERAALRSDIVEAEVSDLTRPENRYERGPQKLLEVYLPIRGPGGRPLLFEAYQRDASVAAGGRRLWLAFLPALLGGLMLLQLINLPLARSLARRLRDGQAEREELLRRSLDASQNERRRIAADLHDGVVQDLVGVSYALSAQATRLNGHGDGAATATLTEGARQTRDSIRSLRTLLVDIYPPSLHDAGLRAAIADVARTTTSRGLETCVSIPDDLELDDRTEELIFRGAQEALRNALKHAGASAAQVRVSRELDRVVLEVTDDGRGFDPALSTASPAAGHFGLAMLGDMARAAGGAFTVTSSPGSPDGTRVRLELPAR